MIRYGNYKLWVREDYRSPTYRLKTEAPWKNEGKKCRCCHESRESFCGCNDWQLDGTRRVVFRKDPDGTIIGLFVDDTVWVEETEADHALSLSRGHLFSGSLSKMHVPVMQFFGANHFPPVKYTTMNVHDSCLLRRAAPSEYAPAIKACKYALHVMKWWEVMVTDPGNSDAYCGWKETGWLKPDDDSARRAEEAFLFEKCALNTVPFARAKQMWKEQNR